MNILEKIKTLLEYGDNHVHKDNNNGFTGPPIMTKNGDHFHRHQNLEDSSVAIYDEDDINHYHTFKNNTISGKNQTI